MMKIRLLQGWKVSARQGCLVALTGLSLLASGCQTGTGMGRLFSGSNTVAQRPVAKPNFEPSVNLNDDQVADIGFAMARQMEQQGQLEKALEAYQTCHAKDGKRADILQRMAVVCDRLGRFSESQQYYEQALKRDPGNAELFCDMGYSQYMQNRYPDAERNYRQALALAKTHERSHVNLGLLLARTGREEEALVQFRQAGLKQAEAHSNCGLALNLAQKFERAQEHYEIALELDPKLASAQHGLQNSTKLIAMANKHKAGAADPASIAKTGPATTQQVAAKPHPTPRVETSMPAGLMLPEAPKGNPVVKTVTIPKATVAAHSASPAQQVAKQAVVAQPEPTQVASAAPVVIETEAEIVIAPKTAASPVSMVKRIPERLPKPPADELVSAMPIPSVVKPSVEAAPARPKVVRIPAVTEASGTSQVQPVASREVSEPIVIEKAKPARVEAPAFELELAPGALKRDRYQGEKE